MRFNILKDDFFVDDTPLKGKYKALDEGEGATYEVDDIGLKPELDLLEKYGLIRLIKSDSQEIEDVDDIIRLTESVEIIEGGSMYLKVKILQHEFTFTEEQLMSGFSLQKYMLRLGKFITIPRKRWREIAQYWLDTGEKMHELSDDDVMREKVMNYLKKCVIYRETEKALGFHSLFFDDTEESVVFCSIDVLVENLQILNRRKMRSVLADYISGQSVQKYVYGEKKRFWRFLIEKCELNIEEQIYCEDLEEERSDEF